MSTSSEDLSLEEVKESLLKIGDYVMVSYDDKQYPGVVKAYDNRGNIK
jgi:hypothetical protein